ncbi:hypothetical protein OFB94_29565, partial [Escherichia coli]|nr:hypothetical protein [Escherichia coli]
CVAHAVVAGAAEVTLRDAHDVAERMVGMPIELGERLQALERRLVEDGLMPPDEAEELIARIRVTSSGLAARPQRPNAVLLLAQKAAEVA